MEIITKTKPLLKLRNKKLIVDEDGEFYEYEVWENDNLISFLHAQLFLSENESKIISLEFKQDFDSSKFISLLKNFSYQSFIEIEGPNINLGYSLSLFEIYYNWQELYFPFQYLEIIREFEKVILKYTFSLPDENINGWNYKFNPKFVIDELSAIIKKDYELKFQLIPEDYSHNSFEILYFPQGNSIIGESMNIFYEKIIKIEKTLYENLEGFKWKQEYTVDEKKFSLEVLQPLLKKMKFQSVRYNHGPDEYGRDFIFNEINKFGKKVNYGLQAKAGDIKGGANSLIDTLISQVDDAFKMPFNSLGEKNNEYISFLIIATSGAFSKNAKDKLLNKLPERFRQYVYFWGKEEIMDLIEINWKEQ